MRTEAAGQFEIVAATPEHVDAVLQLARHLDTVNLPNDRGAITVLLQRSADSFAGKITPVVRREYVFLLRERKSGRAIGTSMIIAQLGRREAPYIYFAVRKEEKYSATLDRHFVHTVLDTTFSYHGPTELGGLVMDPAYRRHPERLGRLISYVRFLFIRARRGDFQAQLLAELLPPFRPDGTSALWEAVGRRFTGLSYRAADQLSRRNKEFIRGLFPGSIYATLLDPEAQSLIGAVGEQTKGVRRLLERVGFRYAERVDPFDGGPHFVADTDDVRAVANALSLPSTRHVRLPCIVAYDSRQPPFFKAVQLGMSPGQDETLSLDMAVAELGLEPGPPLWGLSLAGIGRTASETEDGPG